MKKISLLTLLAGLASFLPAKAQQASGPYVGLTTAVQSTWLFDNKLWDDLNYEYKKTFNAAPIGITGGYKFNNKHAVQLEVIRSRQGMDYDIRMKTAPEADTYRTIGERNIELTYWSVPVLYKVTSGDKVRFNFHIGPQFSFLSDASDVSTFTGEGPMTLSAKKGSTEIAPANPVASQTTTEHIAVEKGTANTIVAHTTPLTRVEGKDDFNKFDIAATLGLGLEVDLVENLYASFNLRLAYGFNDIRSDEQIDRAKANDFHATRNNVVGGLQVGVHYLFRK